MIWGTALLIAVLVGLVIAIYYIRSMFHTERRSAEVDMQDIAHFIQQAKAKEQEAWTNVLTEMGGDDREELNSVYGGDFGPTMSTTTRGDDGKPMATPNSMQLAFFSFWKIPANKIPKTREDANKFIEKYKEKLKTQGYAHRVRRWNRLEVLMVRFCTEYDVDRLNKKCYQVGINKQMLDVVIDQVMVLLSRKKIEWKTVSSVPTYEYVVQHLTDNYPQLQFQKYRN